MTGLPLSLLVSAALAAWVGLAFVPALIEAARRRMATPLPVADSYQEDLRLGPFALASRVRDPEELGRALQNVRRHAQSALVPMENDRHALVLAPGTAIPREAGTEAIVLTASWTEGEEDGAVFASPIVVMGEVHLPPRTRLAGLYAQSLLALGPEATVDRWLYVEGDALIGRGAMLTGTATATETLSIGPDSTFERISGWLVRAGRPGEARTRPQPRRSQSTSSFEPPGHTRTGFGRLFCDGDLEIPESVRVEQDLVATGSVRVGAGAVVLGSIKGRGAVEVGEGAFVQGAVFSEEDVTIGEGAHIGGATVAEGHLSLGAEAEVGTAARPTTASGRSVELALGAGVHGTVWALEHGVVAAADSPFRGAELSNKLAV
ncbi:MAG: hypothetical protein Rubg2KO_13280 [Rubricoccaceae bacterium]